MSSLDKKFNELLSRLNQGRDLRPTGVEPIYYLVFPPNQILEAKRHLPAWQARLHNEGWTVHSFSIANHVAEILGGAKLRSVWEKGDRKDPLEWTKTNKSLTNVIRRGELKDRLAALLDEVNRQPKSIVLVTDLEALHPYARIGSIEAQLYGSFKVPTVFLYPGERTGKTKLKFLGFYPEDGNYRSNHIG